MKETLSLSLLFLLIISANAQNKPEDFQTYRKNMLGEFQGFRSKVLDDYAKFLDGIWNDYEMCTGTKIRPFPKPKEQPVKKNDDPKPIPQNIIPQNIIPTNPIAEDNVPTLSPIAVPSTTWLQVDWCGLNFKLPEANISGDLNQLTKNNLISYLEKVGNSNLVKTVMPQMVNIALAHNFNDWCLFLLVESYIKKIKSNANYNTRNFICWYILTGLGFDARLSVNGNNLFYLVPFKQLVYARSYIKINDKPYYIWGEGSIDENAGFSSPQVPDDVGNEINMVLTKPLKLPYLAKKYNHTFAGRTLSVEVNEHLIKVMKCFPQMQIPAYALSTGDNKMRSQVLIQMKEFIKGMNEFEAANFILQFIQSFEYSTDEEQFGYEKPFFIEETLYYPKCDCEDRSILYHYLITQLLGRDVHLVHYPNHECTAVNFSQKINADSYLYNGKQYVICDPTYIGASIGMCMPDYKNVKPEIDNIE